MIYPRWFQDLSRADFLKSAGLYVKRDRLSLVRMRKYVLRLAIVEEETREIPPAEDASSRRQALSEAIRSLLPHFNPRDPFYVCLSSDQAIVVPLFLPQVAQENLSEVVGYEIERQLPFRREDVYYDFLTMGKKGDKLSLLLFAVPKRELDGILDVLFTFGIRPRGVETTATALANYVLFCAGGITGPALVLGGQSRVLEMIGLNARTNGWGQEPEILFAHWLPEARWTQGLGRELVHTFLRESPKLFGWGYIQDFLSSMNQESLQFEDLLAMGKTKLAAHTGLDHFYSVPAVGTALRGLREATFSVNLLPGARAEGQSRALSRLNAFLTVLLLLGLLAWGGSYPVKDGIRLRQFQRENQKLVSSVEALRRQEEELKRLRKELSFLSGLSERRGEILSTLDELSRVVPSTAYLSTFRYRDGIVEFQGSAENASNLVPLLERSPLFENVASNAPTTRGRDNRETFSLKAGIEKPKEKKTKP